MTSHKILQVLLVFVAIIVVGILFGSDEDSGLSALSAGVFVFYTLPILFVAAIVAAIQQARRGDPLVSSSSGGKQSIGDSIKRGILILLVIYFFVLLISIALN